MQGIPETLTERIAFLLQLATGKVQAAGEEALGEIGISGREYGLIALAAGVPRPQVALGATIGLDRTTTMELLAGLEHRGLIHRRPDPTNRRANLIELTSAGEATRAAAYHALADCETRFLAPLTAHEISTLQDLLRRLLH